MKRLFREGDRVLVTTRKGKRVIELVGTFQGMVTKVRAAVLVWDRTGTALDEEGERVVALTSLAPYHNEQDDAQRRARHAARLYKQGARMFRLGHADGKRLMIAALDAEQGVAFGTVYGRKTIMRIPLTDLWPMTYA